MTHHDDDQLVAWLYDKPPAGSDGALERALNITRHARQRPAWLVAAAGGTIRTQAARPSVLRFALVLGAVAAVTALLVGGLVAAGILRLPPAPSPPVVESPGPSPSLLATPAALEDLIFDCASEQASARVQTNEWQAGPAPSGAVRSGWIAAWGIGETPELVLVNPLSGEICSLMAFEGYGHRSDGRPGGGQLVWSPDGSTLAIFLHNGLDATDLFVWSPLGLSGPILHVESPSSLYAPSWSPDGSRLAVGDDSWTLAGPADQASVWIVASDGSAAHRVRADCVACNGGTAYWSPSGDRVAMGTDLGIAVGSANGQTLRIMSGKNTGGSVLGWANEGYVRVLDVAGHLVDIPLDVRAEPIDHGAFPGSRGLLSPDGMRMVIRGPFDATDLMTDLMICDLDSSRCDLIASNIPVSVPLWWSPDGQTIGYLMDITCGPCPSQPLPSQGIWLINPDGTGQRQLTNGLFMDFVGTFMPWQPRW